MVKKWAGLLLVILTGLPLFQFSCILETKESPTYYIAVISPRQDTTAQAGNNFCIQWRSSVKKFPSVTISLHNIDSKITVSIAQNIENTGLFYWKVPIGIVSGSNYIIQVTGIGDTIIDGTSALFSIVNNTDIYEPDDSIPMATEIPTNGTIQTHTRSYNGDVDWYKFSARAGTSYLIQSDKPRENAIHMNISNPNSYQYNAGDSFSSVIWTCTTDGMCYFHISSKDTNSYTYRDNAYYTIFVKSSKGILTILNPKQGATYAPGGYITIQWQASSNVNALSAKILRNDSIIAANDNIHTSTPQFTWYLPLGLSASTNYQLIMYSKIDSSIHSEAVTFSVVPCRYSMVVSTPDNSTTMWTGDTTAINWNCTGVSIRSGFFDYSMDLCRDTIKVLNIRTVSDTGTCIWILPYNLPSSSNYQIRIRYINDTSAYCFSKEFTINHTPSSFKIVSPSAGTIVTNDTIVTIQWSVIGEPVPSYKIDLFDSTKMIMNIASITGNVQMKKNWRIPASLSSGVYRLKFTANEDSTICSWSSNFSITHVPTFNTITSPVANTTCSGHCTVTWQSTGPVGDRVDISLWNDTVRELNGYRGYIFNNGTYDFKIPVNVLQGDRYRIKIIDCNDTSIQSYSDFFTIVPIPKSITITSPNDSSIFIADKNGTLTWTSIGVVDEYSSGNAFNIDLYDSIYYISTICKLGPVSKKFFWTVPVDLPTKSTYRIKITSIQFPDIYTFSEYFTVTQ